MATCLDSYSLYRDLRSTSTNPPHHDERTDGTRYSPVEQGSSWEVDRRSRYNEYESRHVAIDSYYHHHHHQHPMSRGGYHPHEAPSRGAHPYERSHPHPGAGSGAMSSFPSMTHHHQVGHHPHLSGAMPGNYPNLHPPSVTSLTRAVGPALMHQMAKVHRVGCKCKKSRCLKKYCECFSNMAPEPAPGWGWDRS